MKIILFIGYLLLFRNNEMIGQTNQYIFQIAYLMPDNTTMPASLFELTFNGHEVKANSSGIVFFTRENSSRSILISLRDSNYVVISPKTIAFPEGASFITTIVLHKKTETEKAYKTLVKMLDKKNIYIGDAISKNTKANQKMQKEIDSVLKVVTQKYKISNNDLRRASEILAGRDKYFNLISASLEGYLNEAKDIRDIFKNMLSFSLENPKSFFLFDSTIKVYNNSYNDLNTYNNEYEKAVETYWGSPELASGFHNVFDYAINDIHRTNILALNTLFIQKANMYIHEKNKKKRKDLKEQIAATLSSILPVLDNNLVVLENKTKYIIGKLEVEREILNN
jgi:hypothetical protein